jgi:hypothetical protein
VNDLIIDWQQAIAKVAPSARQSAIGSLRVTAIYLRGACYHYRMFNFWETENSGRLDRSHRGSHRRDIPCLVDASDVRALNAFSVTVGVAA